MRLVIGPDAMRSSEWTLPTTMSRRLSSSGVWSSEPSDRMSTSMPVRIRNGASSAFSAATSSSCRSSRSGDSPLATVSVGEWSVSTMYSWPSSMRGLGHLADRRAAVAPVGVDVAVAAQRLAQLRAELGHHPAAGRLQPTEVDRLLAAQALGDRPLGHLADAGQAAQRPRRTCSLERAPAPWRGHGGRRVAEGAHPVGRLVGELQQQGDAPQVGDRVARIGHRLGTLTTRWRTSARGIVRPRRLTRHASAAAPTFASSGTASRTSRVKCRASVRCGALVRHS